MQLVDTAEAARRVKLSVATLETYRSRKRGPAYVKQPCRVLYRVEDLERWLASRVAEVPA